MRKFTHQIRSGVRDGWKWIGIASDHHGRIVFLIGVAGLIIGAVTWSLQGYGIVTTILVILVAILILVCWTITLRVARRNTLREAEERAELAQREHDLDISASHSVIDDLQEQKLRLINETRVIPAGWSAIIRGVPTPGSVVEVVPPGCEIVAAGPAAFGDDTGSSVSGRDNRVYNAAGVTVSGVGNRIGERPYPLYVVP